MNGATWLQKRTTTMGGFAAEAHGKAAHAKGVHSDSGRPQRKNNKISVPSVSLWLTYALAVLLALAAGAAVYAQAGGGYDLTWNTVDGGGAIFASGGGYTVGGTAGQPDAAVWSGGGYTLPQGPIAVSGGFWHAAQAGTPPGGPGVYLPLILRER